MRLPYELYSVKQIRELEGRALSTVTEESLMERAARAAFNTMREFYPYAMNIVVFSGAGNNGGDGFVLARLAQQSGMSVQVYTLGDLSKLGPSASQAFEALGSFGVPVAAFNEEVSLDDADVVIDAMLGIGLSGHIRGEYLEAIDLINDSDVPVVAVDVPTGIDADTGRVLGQAVVASLTVTFIGVKQGLLTGEAVSYCGELVCDALGLNEEFIEQPINALRIDEEDLENLLPQREPHSHKGDFGHVVVIGGDEGMPGAARLAAEAALRVGAGLVSVLTRPLHVPIVMSGRPELMCYGVEATDEVVKALLARADVVVVGPGMGQSPWSQALIELALAFKGAKLIDAGALNFIAEQKVHLDNAIVTPHPGEAARLLGLSAKEIQENRFEAVLELNKRYADVVVLKGAGTLIQCKDELPYLCHLGNPGMATAGTGDVLAGTIAGFKAQGLDNLDAAMTGVVVHGFAGDKACDAVGEHGLLASHLFHHFSDCFKIDSTQYDWSHDDRND